jgi:hypothetical protein
MYVSLLLPRQGLLAALGQPLTVLDVRHRMHSLAAASTPNSVDTQHSEQQQQVDAAQLAHAFFAAVRITSLLCLLKLSEHASSSPHASSVL